ncbi:MAG TPA: hypothetical protein VGE10_05715 [Zeimonas sp.]
MNENMNEDRDDDARQLADEAFARYVLSLLPPERRLEAAAAVLANVLIGKVRHDDDEQL